MEKQNKKKVIILLSITFILAIVIFSNFDFKIDNPIKTCDSYNLQTQYKDYPSVCYDTEILEKENKLVIISDGNRR